MTTEGTELTLDQRRAKFAYGVVSNVKKAGKVKDDYTGLAQNLPTMILQNGLGQAVAFLMSKAKGQENSAEGQLLTHLSRWLLASPSDDAGDKRPTVIDVGASGTERLMAALLKTTPHEWARAQHEAVGLATWLKRFAEALMPKLDGEPKEKEESSHGQ